MRRDCKGYESLPPNLKDAFAEMEMDLILNDSGVVAVSEVEDIGNFSFWRRSIQTSFF